MSVIKYFSVLIALLCLANPVLAQADSIPSRYSREAETPSAVNFIVPSALIAYGAIAKNSDNLLKFDRNIDDAVQKNIHRQYRLDDYIPYAPYAAIYGLDLCGIGAQHSWLDRTLLIGTSLLLTTGGVDAVKRVTHITRPDNSDDYSFPSGHTARAFVGAHILFKEYRNVSPYIGVAGYGIAFTTGALRIVNRRHWFSDVVTGAGVGILSAELSYLLLPVWHKVFKMPSEQRLAIVPFVQQNTAGIGGMWVF